MRKRFLLAISLVLTLLLATCIIAACHPKDPSGNNLPEGKYAVSLSFDSSMGSVGISPSSGNGYSEGDRVTITATPSGNLLVREILLDGTPVNLDEDLQTGVCTFSFNVNANATIAVKFDVIALRYDSRKGSVEINPENPSLNNPVTVRAEAKPHFQLESVLVNGTAVTLASGAYSFNLSAPTRIGATFLGEEISEAALNSLKGQTKYDGSYFYDFETDEYDAHMDIMTVFGADTYIYQKESDSVSGQIYYEYIYKLADNGINLAAVCKNLNNEVTETVDTDNYNDFGNPFRYIAGLDGSYIRFEEEGIYAVTDTEMAKRIATPITGWNESIASMRLSVTGNKVTAIDIITNRMNPTGNDGESYVSTYHFDIKEHGTAQVPQTFIQPLPHVAEHANLIAALDAAQAEDTYKVTMFQHEPGYVEPEGGETRPGYGDITSNIYITETLAYNDVQTSYANPNGHRVNPDNGYVYPFDVIAGNITLFDPYDADATYFRSSFAHDFFAIELFEYVGDNKFVLDASAAYSTDYGVYETIAYLIAPIFSLNGERVNNYATRLEITLTADNKLEKVFFVYSAYGFTEERTLTYDFGWTGDEQTLGLDFTNADKSSKLDPFKGSYTDADGNSVTVDDVGFIINGRAAEVIGYSEENIQGNIFPEFTLSWSPDGMSAPLTLYVTKYSTNQLRIASEDSTLFWTLTKFNDDVPEIDAAYRGVWETHDEKGDVEYTIRIQSHAVFLNDDPIDISSFNASEGVVATKGNLNFDFSLVQIPVQSTPDSEIEYETLLRYHIEYMEDVDGEPTKLYVEGYAEKTSDNVGIEVPSKYVGVYFNAYGDEKLTITYTSIVYSIKDPLSLVYDDKVFTIEGYSESVGFVGKLDGKTSTIYFYSGSGPANEDHIVFAIGNSEPLDLYRTVTLKSHYIGIWTPQIEDQKYMITITEREITISGEKEDGTQFSETILSRDIEYEKDTGRYIIHPEFTEYTVYLHYAINHSTGQPILYMYSNEEDFLVSFKKNTDDPGTSVIIPLEYYGIWEGTRQDTDETYRLEIDETSIKLTITGTSGQPTEMIFEIDATDPSDFYKNIDMHYEDEIYYLQYIEAGRISLAPENYEYRVFLSPVQE